MSDIFPFGTPDDGGQDVRCVRPKTYMVQRMNDGRDRLRIGVNGLHTFHSLLSAMDPNFWVLYLLLVPMARETESGRYQSPRPLAGDELNAFLDEFGGFLEIDGRHEIWVHSVPTGDFLVYDRHEIVYAYGNLDRFRAILEIEGYESGEVLIPNPHSHHYHSSYNPIQFELLKSLDWQHSPLQPSDNP